MPAKPKDEKRRLAELRQYGILDTVPEDAYDDITFLASQICGTPIALVSLVDESRQWFKARIGLEETETARELAFCAHAILEPGELMVVPDARNDERFSANPLVTSGPRIRFYAGAPLVTQSGSALGTLCVIDQRPRRLSDEQRRALRALSRQVMAQLELRKLISDLTAREGERKEYEQQLERYQRQLEENYAQLAELSRTDELTGLRNRRAFHQKLNEQFARAVRYDLPLSLVIADVDHFKRYNDTYGHPAGDEVLKRVAQIMSSEMRATDLVARHGGEEFAILLSDTQIDGAYVLAERFRRAVELADWPEAGVTVSLGVATRTAQTADGSALVATADRALYEAKRGGRNRVVRASQP